MPSTNKTKNLELSKFVGSDTPQFLTDYNQDMQKIDDAFALAMQNGGGSTGVFKNGFKEYEDMVDSDFGLTKVAIVMRYIYTGEDPKALSFNFRGRHYNLLDFIKEHLIINGNGVFNGQSGINIDAYAPIDAIVKAGMRHVCYDMDGQAVAAPVIRAKHKAVSLTNFIYASGNTGFQVAFLQFDLNTFDFNRRYVTEVNNPSLGEFENRYIELQCSGNYSNPANCGCDCGGNNSNGTPPSNGDGFTSYAVSALTKQESVLTISMDNGDIHRLNTPNTPTLKAGDEIEIVLACDNDARITGFDTAFGKVRKKLNFTLGEPLDLSNITSAFGLSISQPKVLMSMLEKFDMTCNPCTSWIDCSNDPNNVYWSWQMPFVEFKQRFGHLFPANWLDETSQNGCCCSDWTNHGSGGVCLPSSINFGCYLFYNNETVSGTTFDGVETFPKGLYLLLGNTDSSYVRWWNPVHGYDIVVPIGTYNFSVESLRVKHK